MPPVVRSTTSNAGLGGTIRDQHVAVLTSVGSGFGLAQVHDIHVARRPPRLGLTWSNVDVDAGTVAIRQTVTSVAGQIRICGLTKTGRSRVVDLDSRTVAMLRSLWARQAQERLLVRVACRDSGFVFCHPDGRPYHPEQVQQLRDDPNGHPAAPVVLAGAVLEEFLRAMLATCPVQPVGKPGLSSYATALQKGALITLGT